MNPGSPRTFQDIVWRSHEHGEVPGTKELPWPEERLDPDRVVLVGNMLSVLCFEREGAKLERVEVEPGAPEVDPTVTLQARYAWYERAGYAMARISIARPGQSGEFYPAPPPGRGLLEASYLFQRDADGSAWSPLTLLTVADTSTPR